MSELPTFSKLSDIGNCDELILKEKPVSPSVWCGMFSGKTIEEHRHDSFVANGSLVKRQDIDVIFIWDILHGKGKAVKALNVPFVVPPYCFGVEFKAVGFGLPTNDKEWMEELDRITEVTRELLIEKPDLLISVYTLLDRVQHFHWGEDCVLEWYRRLDDKIGQLIFDTGFLEEKGNKLIIISDHGFCSFGEANIQTLPLKTEHGELKGDHHENAILITVNLDERIERPQDVFFTLKKEFELE